MGGKESRTDLEIWDARSLGEDWQEGSGYSRFLDEVNTLGNVALEPGDGSLQQLLLLLGDIAQDVDRLLDAVRLWHRLISKLD